MKTNKVLFAVVLFLFANSFLYAQDALKKGVYNLSGSISYSNSKETIPNTTIKQFSFSVAPGFNYFIIDNLLIGGNISFQYSESEWSSNFFTTNDIYRRFGIGPNVRYYFSGSEIIPFIGASADYIKVFNTDLEGRSFTGTAGINYFLSQNAALEPYLSYSISSYFSNEDINTFSLGVRVSYFIIN